MLVTINTDASFDSMSNSAAYAFWIVSNNGRFMKSNVLKEKVDHSHEAEFKAILNSLYFLFNKTSWVNIDKVIINTDSMEVLRMINGGETRNWALNLKQFFNQYVKNSKAKIIARHVKAHSNKNDKRSYVNNWCDRNAKAKMKKIFNK